MASVKPHVQRVPTHSLLWGEEESFEGKVLTL